LGLHQNGIFSIKSMYLALISDSRVRLNLMIWKLKLPWKIKIFLWYLEWGVILTKDNLSQRNWRGVEGQCVFCSQPKSIQHLFFDCHFAKFIWTAVHISFNIQKPISILHLFNDWASSMGRNMWKLLLLGAATLIWTIWTNRNDIAFDNIPTKAYMQVLFHRTHWLRLWAQLQRHEVDSSMIKTACRVLESMVREIFTNFDWQF
jgi:hypothetical protein